MVKVGSPLMSNTASGKIGERLVFSRRSSGQQARFQKAQKDKISEKRVKQREVYNTGVSAWNTLSESQQNFYILRAKKLKMSGYNLYMREYLVENNVALSLSYFGIRFYGKMRYGRSYQT